MKKKDDTPVNQLILETVYMLKDKKDETVVSKLEEFGLVETQGKKKRIRKFTDKGVKRALGISLGIDDENR